MQLSLSLSDLKQKKLNTIIEWTTVYRMPSSVVYKPTHVHRETTTTNDAHTIPSNTKQMYAEIRWECHTKMRNGMEKLRQNMAW